jgi:hypothetical protein
MQQKRCTFVVLYKKRNTGVSKRGRGEDKICFCIMEINRCIKKVALSRKVTCNVAVSLSGGRKSSVQQKSGAYVFYMSAGKNHW